MPPEILRLLADLRTASDRAHLRLETYDKGGIAVSVDIGHRSFEMFCGPISGNGVSETNDETLPFTQHDRYFSTIGEACAQLLALVTDAARELELQPALTI